MADVLLNAVFLRGITVESSSKSSAGERFTEVCNFLLECRTHLVLRTDLLFECEFRVALPFSRKFLGMSKLGHQVGRSLEFATVWFRGSEPVVRAFLCSGLLCRNGAKWLSVWACESTEPVVVCRLRDDVESWEVDLERHPSGVVYVREDGTIDPEPVVAWSSPDIDDDAAALIHRAFSDGRRGQAAQALKAQSLIHVDANAIGPTLIMLTATLRGRTRKRRCVVGAH
ncbi:hypothetical protein NFJ02_19g34890 [Pycnococcus provasolii]